MPAYYRTTDGAIRDFTVPQFNALPDRAVWRLFFMDAMPALTATQIAKRDRFDVTATECHFAWTVRDKTADELAAEAAETEKTADRTALASAISALRNGTGTQAERLARVERACVYLLRHAGGL